MVKRKGFLATKKLKLKGVGLLNMKKGRFVPVSRIKNNTPGNKRFRKILKGKSIKKVSKKRFILRNRDGTKSKIRL